jgi:hypothetical protein
VVDLRLWFLFVGSTYLFWIYIMCEDLHVCVPSVLLLFVRCVILFELL